MEATITIASVERKEGFNQAKNKPWVKFTIHAQDNTKYSTFDAQLANIANSSIGKVAKAHFDTGQYGNDLTGLIVTNDAPAPQAPQASPGNGVGPDWDRIAVQKTRCALWVALYNGGLHDAASASKLVYEAEKDIFGRVTATQGVGGGLDSDIPFAPTV